MLIILTFFIFLFLQDPVHSQLSPSARNPKNSVLFQAIDAYRQAKKLEQQLSASESAVSGQTQELTRELNDAKVAAGKFPSEYFEREQNLDQQLLSQAEDETQRDARLVSQAQSEMQQDREYLENAFDYDPGAEEPSLQNILPSADAPTEWLSMKCPGMLCARAVSFDYLPQFCALSEPSEVGGFPSNFHYT
jgi:hypothetical protein